MSDEALGRHTADINLLKGTTVSSKIFDVPTPTEFTPVDFDIYSPTRLDYFAARALQGLVVGRSEKDRRECAKDAVAIALHIIELID